MKKLRRLRTEVPMDWQNPAAASLLALFCPFSSELCSKLSNCRKIENDLQLHCRLSIANLLCFKSLVNKKVDLRSLSGGRTTPPPSSLQEKCAQCVFWRKWKHVHAVLHFCFCWLMFCSRKACLFRKAEEKQPKEQALIIHDMVM